MPQLIARRHLPFAMIFIAVAAIYLVGGMRPLDRAVGDLGFRVATRDAIPEVVIVAVDPASLRDLQVWPWPRGYHATVLENLIAAGARKVAFDIDFSSRSNAEDDEQFTQALAAAGRSVILPVFAQGSGLVQTRAPQTSTGPLPSFAEHAALATINVRPDRDGRARRYPLSGEYLGRPVPSLAAELLGHPALGGDDGFLIDFGIRWETIPRLSYLDVLAGRFDPALVRDRVVIIGSTAVELGDQLAVPRWNTLPGCVVQALAVESLAQNRALRSTSPIFTLLFTAAVCLLMGALEGWLTWRRGLALTAGVALGAPAVACLIQAFLPLLCDISPIVWAAAGCYGFSLTRNIDRQALGMLVRDRRIVQTENLMRHVVSNSFDAIVTLREDGAIVTFNRVAQKMFGVNDDEALGRHVSEFVRLPSAEARDARGDAYRNHRALYETEGRCKDGRRFPMELAVTWIVAEGARRRVMFMRDITERKAQQEALRYQATHDVLTDLPNRNLLQERVEEALVAAKQNGWPVAFLLLDLDRFKEINDTLGHHIGDLLLRKIARRLESTVRESDTIARLGGDEFAVLLPATGLEVARQVARKLAQALEEPFQVDGLLLQVDTSVGITLYPEHGAEAAALIRRADVAMYVAKRERSGIAIYDSDQDFTSIRLLALTGDLRRAIQQDELSLHYQPKISARDGRPVGVEVLARWRHAEHGKIPPEEFIGLAEHSGLIRPLTAWVLETALRQAARWHAEGIDLNVSINLSARNLLDESLPRDLMNVLRQHALGPQMLTLEITESVIMEDPRRALEVLTELHAMGVGISIDDFGTGYSSLGYLRKLPANEIKIDKSFVMEMDRNRDDRTIVHSTIELAHNLGLTVVAEGVETEEVWRELRRLGCDTGQGYLFSRPLPAGRFAEWYRETVETARHAVVGEAG